MDNEPECTRCHMANEVLAQTEPLQLTNYLPVEALIECTRTHNWAGWFFCARCGRAFHTEKKMKRKVDVHLIFETDLALDVIKMNLIADIALPQMVFIEVK